jgi:UrcA family protein
MNSITTFIAAAAIATLSAGAAQADQTVEKVRVTYSDLDLSKADGMKTLERRIERAARFTCGGDNGPTTLKARASYEACFEKAVEGAMVAVRSTAQPVLAAR